MELKDMETITLCRIKYNYCTCPEENLVDYILLEDRGDVCLIRPLFWNPDVEAPTRLIETEKLEIYGAL